MIVVDASVAVKWFFFETGSEEANALLRGSEKLAAPALIRIEVTAAMTRRARVGEVSRQAAQAATFIWHRALALGAITLSPDEHDLPGAVELALGLRHPLQDCLYLAAAQRTGGSLVTADPKFAERAARSYSNVSLLV